MEEVRIIFEECPPANDKTQASSKMKSESQVFPDPFTFVHGPTALAVPLAPLLYSGSASLQRSTLGDETMLQDSTPSTQQEDTQTDTSSSAAPRVLSSASLPKLLPNRGYWATVEYRLLPMGLIEEVVLAFSEFCCSSDFVLWWVMSGFTNPVFFMNPHLTEANACVNKFRGGLATVGPKDTLGCAFHGTKSYNVASILKDGLDPTRRRKQSLGPGEYFAKDPKNNFAYCRNDNEMIVFVIVIPEDQDHSPAVVVENNCHQIPIGTVRFSAPPFQARESVARRVVPRSNFPTSPVPAPPPSHLEIQELQRIVTEKIKARNEEVSVREEIAQYLLNNLVDVASELYKKHNDRLLHASKREIAWYVKPRLDEDIVCYYFPGLPGQMEIEGCGKATVETELSDAKRLYEQAVKKRVVHLICSGDVTSAGLLYTQSKSDLQRASKQEIAHFVKSKVTDKNQVAIFFSDLASLPNDKYRPKALARSRLETLREERSKCKGALVIVSIQGLRSQVEEKTKAYREASVRTKIVHFILQMDIGGASELYVKNKDLLQDASKREISWYVKPRLDQGLLSSYFPNLPEPMDNDSRARASVLTTEEQAATELSDAKRRYEEAVRKQVIELILSDNPSSAGQLYTQHKSGLQAVSKREIFKQVKAKVSDQALIANFFSDLGSLDSNDSS